MVPRGGLAPLEPLVVFAARPDPGGASSVYGKLRGGVIRKKPVEKAEFAANQLEDF